jgi:hypothetical protein
MSKLQCFKLQGGTAFICTHCSAFNRTALVVHWISMNFTAKCHMPYTKVRCADLYCTALPISALFRIWKAQCTLGWSGGTVACAVLKSVVPGTAFLCVLCWMVQKSNAVHEKKNVHSACLYMPWIDVRVYFAPFIANLSSYRAGQWPLRK